MTTEKNSAFSIQQPRIGDRSNRERALEIELVSTKLAIAAMREQQTVNKGHTNANLRLLDGVVAQWVDEEPNRLELFFDTPALRDEAIAVLQNLPQFHHELRQRSIGSAIGFFEDKPEIYNHDSLAFHILQNARMRHEFMREVGALTSQDVAELSQSQAKNRAAHAHRAKTENKLFAVEYQGDQRYPAFQFDAQTGKPKPIIKQMLELLNSQWSGWQLALWFVTPNGYLDDQTPMDRLDASPEAVMEALRKEAGEVEF